MRNKWVSFLTTAFVIAGALMIALAYLMIWQPIFVVQLVQFAVAIGLACLGGILLYACFVVLTALLRKG